MNNTNENIVENNCWMCKSSSIGRCFGKYYGEDITDRKSICNGFVDGRSPDAIDINHIKTWKPVQVCAYIIHRMTRLDIDKRLSRIHQQEEKERGFYESHTRNQLRAMVAILYPYRVTESLSNKCNMFGTSMTRRRLFKHIKLYLDLHGYKY